ncbi:Na+/H+ antiporter NhaA [Streptosporangium sp. NPDC087985]|uniref:Na+/H+ antiporter NhaA n=1 Tax=Streptosporangium sp. NPDC087985 TaxID=3366196 RepID=UPI003819DB59
MRNGALAVPVFAFFAAGVNLGGLSRLAETLTTPVAVGITAGLLAGKPIGILAATWGLTRFTRATLDEGLAWIGGDFGGFGCGFGSVPASPDVEKVVVGDGDHEGHQQSLRDPAVREPVLGLAEIEVMALDTAVDPLGVGPDSRIGARPGGAQVGEACRSLSRWLRSPGRRVMDFWRQIFGSSSS